ncbi:MAG: hypothetical protein KGO48_15445, partial [Alphaproteobacteria bacterium]|nr:hypothetical protein [Alphaproteobacteria bacterium]
PARNASPSLWSQTSATPSRSSSQSIVMKNGKVSQKFGSKAKEKRFAQEDRRGHRSEYRKPVGKGLRLGPNRKNRYVLRIGEKPKS